MFNKTVGDILKEPVFKKRNAYWVDKISKPFKKYKKAVHFSIKMTRN